MRRPDFFLIGAPKCGTTTLANWLREHLQIFMTQNPKEPMFFDVDIPNDHRMTLEQYERLFKKATNAHLAVGEASTTYLRSHKAVQNILEYSPEARFLVAVRNPVDMAISVHAQLLYTKYESIKEFQEAWYAQEDRLQGSRLPASSRTESARLQYGNVCRVGKQVQRLYRAVPKDRVKIIFMEDMKAGPRQVYLDILDFLHVPDDGRSEFPVANVRKKPRVDLLSRLLAYAGQSKKLLGLKGVHTGMLGSLHAWNRLPLASTELDETFRRELIDYFSDDINLLATLTERDLSVWLR